MPNGPYRGSAIAKVGQLTPGMLTRPAGHEAKDEAEARKSEAEHEAEAQIFFRGRGHNVWGRARGQTR